MSGEKPYKCETQIFYFFNSCIFQTQKTTHWHQISTIKVSSVVKNHMCVTLHFLLSIVLTCIFFPSVTFSMTQSNPKWDFLLVKNHINGKFQYFCLSIKLYIFSNSENYIFIKNSTIGDYSVVKNHINVCHISILTFTISPLDYFHLKTV